MRQLRCIFLFTIVIGSFSSQGQQLDYSQSKLWLALPDKTDYADVVPDYEDMKDGQASAKADVFYIHPTTYYAGATKNDKFRKPSTKRIAKSALLSQASVFNGCYKIYAPRYRQASFKILQKTLQMILGNRKYLAQGAFGKYLAICPPRCFSISVSSEIDSQITVKYLVVTGEPMFCFVNDLNGCTHAFLLIFYFAEEDHPRSKFVSKPRGGY